MRALLAQPANGEVAWGGDKAIVGGESSIEIVEEFRGDANVRTTAVTHGVMMHVIGEVKRDGVICDACLGDEARV